jgi:hypothetical protein
MTTSDTFILHRGSDFRESLIWPDGNGGAANLTGFTVDATDVQADLQALLQVTSPMLSSGVINFGFDWVPTIKDGRRMYFRLRVTDPTGFDQTTNRLWIDVR